MPSAEPGLADDGGAAPVLSVLLPTYDEGGNIEPLVRRLTAALAGVDHELVVVDDRSPDGTAEIARALIPDVPSLRVIVREPPPGLTASLRDGVEAARGRHVAWLDCDLSHPPELIAELLEAVTRGDAAIAVASRYAPGGADARGSWFVRAYGRIINGLASRLVSPAVRDYTTGYVVAPRRLVRQLGLRGEYGEYCIDFLGRAVQSGHTVREIPYVMVPRQEGESKTLSGAVDFLRKGVRYLAVVGRLALRSPGAGGGGPGDGGGGD